MKIILEPGDEPLVKSFLLAKDPAAKALADMIEVLPGLYIPLKETVAGVTAKTTISYPVAGPT